jgi:hypothetical protein
MKASKFVINNTKIFQDWGIYWNRPDTERTDSYREYDFIYEARNQLTDKFKIVKIFKPEFENRKHQSHQEVYACEEGFLVLQSFYYDQQNFITAIEDGFKMCPPIYNNKTFSMFKFVKDESELQSLLS